MCDPKVLEKNCKELVKLLKLGAIVNLEPDEDRLPFGRLKTEAGQDLKRVKNSLK